MSARTPRSHLAKLADLLTGQIAAHGQVAGHLDDEQVDDLVAQARRGIDDINNVLDRLDRAESTSNATPKGA